MVLGINDSYQVMAAQITSCCQPWEAATNNQHTTPRVIVEGDDMWWTPKSEKEKIIHFKENAMLVTKNIKWMMNLALFTVNMWMWMWNIVFLQLYICIYQWVFLVHHSTAPWKWKQDSPYHTNMSIGFTLRVMIMQWWYDPTIWYTPVN